LFNVQGRAAMAGMLLRGVFPITLGSASRLDWLRSRHGHAPETQKRLEPHYRAQRPEGPGPFPAILLVPGCGGIAPARIKTAEELMRQGYVVVFVDYVSARNVQTACRGEVSLDEVAQDIRAAS